MLCNILKTQTCINPGTTRKRSRQSRNKHEPTQDDPNNSTILDNPKTTQQKRNRSNTTARHPKTTQDNQGQPNTTQTNRKTTQNNRNTTQDNPRNPKTR